ncbi:hypothetical protein [Streptacidiphilus anmyonensis]|uniref:hypothetical protein n=1 Tax=Streptacidiphilus anmyonensis TaxID=405782 RepID=UPI000693F73D|nr:hypothetical protein [Streptacidiphilus anmyonensis]
MSTNGEPQDAVPADGGTMHLRMPPEDTPPAPQDAVPEEPPGTVRLGRAAGAARSADPDAVPTVRFPAEPEAMPTVRLPAQPDAVATVRLPSGPQRVPTVRQPDEPEAVPTVRLPAGSAPVPTPTVQLPVEPQVAGAAAAPAPTLQVPVAPQTATAAAPVPAPTLHMSVGPALAAAPASAPALAPAPIPAPAPVPAVETAAAGAASGAAPDPAGLIRFGPGVPDPKTARTIAMWKGEVAPEPQAEEGRKRRGWLFWVPVLLVFLALLGWWLDGVLAPPQLKLTGASVQVAPAAVGCGGKATLTATVATDGRAGTFHYRWTRNDGTDSGLLTETVAAGTRQVSLPLIWTLSGPGTFDGKATLQIQDHPALTRTGTFTYSCAG